MVKKDGTVSVNNQRYEVNYTLVGQQVAVVFDPHEQKVLYVESISDGRCLGPATLLDRTANNHRKRVRTTSENNPPESTKAKPPKDSIVEQALQDQARSLGGLASQSFAEQSANDPTKTAADTDDKSD